MARGLVSWYVINDLPVQPPAKQRRLKSARLIGEYESSLAHLHPRVSDFTRYEKPWIANSPYKIRERWDKVILWGCMAMGFLLGCILCYFAYANVPRHQVGGHILS